MERPLCPKFIIESGAIILGKVTFHKELVTNKEDVKGGGWFKIDSQNKIFTLYDSSHDYGKAKVEDLKKCIAEGQAYSDKYLLNCLLPKYKFQYDTGQEIIDLHV